MSSPDEHPSCLNVLKSEEYPGACGRCPMILTGRPDVHCLEQVVGIGLCYFNRRELSAITSRNRKEPEPCPL